MAERMSMDDILSDKPEEKQEKPEPEVKAETPEAAEKPGREESERVTSRRAEHRKKELEAQGRDPETGQFVSKEKTEEKPAEAKVEKTAEKTADKSAPEMTEKERAFLRSAEDERKKRQALEAELARLRTQPQAQPQAQPEKPKAFWDDPEGYFESQRQQLQQRETGQILRVSEMMARTRYTDFDEKVEKFTQLTRDNPALAHQMLRAPDPAEFAYRIAKNTMDVEAAGGVDKLLEERLAKARAEERAKVEAEFKAKQEELERKRAELPGTLSDVRGAATRGSAPVFTGPTPMADILKH